MSSSLIAARQVFERYAPLAKRIAASLSKFPALHLREDLEAAALTALWRAALSHAASPRPGSSLEGYVVLTVRGACLDELRAQDWLPRRLRKTHGARFVRVPIDAIAHVDRVPELSVPADAEVRLAEKERLERLRSLIAQLRKRDRQILTQFLAGQSWRDRPRARDLPSPHLSDLGAPRGEAPE